MKLVRRALYAVALLAITRLVRKRRLERLNRMPVAMTPAGISEVDPQPLTEMLEAVDPDAIDVAHHEVADQRAKLDAIPRR